MVRLSASLYRQRILAVGGAGVVQCCFGFALIMISVNNNN